MEDWVIKIVWDELENAYDRSDIYVYAEIGCKNVASDFRSFILWKDSPESGIITYFNGIEKNRDRISYDLKDKNYTLDQLFEYWVNKGKK